MDKPPTLNSLDGQPVLWAQRDDESPSKYSIFMEFLAIPLPRTYKALAAITNYSENTLKQYAWDLDWKTRAAAYDEYRAQQTVISRHETIQILQNEVIKGAIEDAKALLDLWRNTLKSNGLSTLDVLRMVDSRVRIDSMLRRAAEMPASYLPTPAAEPPQESDWEITKDGTKRADDANSKAPVTPSLPAKNTRPSNEVQSPQLWSEMGEEFSSEE